MIDYCDFQQLAADYNVIPLVRQRLADFETPIAIAARLQRQGRFFLLESVEGGEQWGRYSILGFDIREEFVIDEGVGKLHTDQQEIIYDGNPVDALQRYLAGFRMVEMPDLPRFCGGAVGYFSFESVRYFERCGETKPNDGRFPDGLFLLADRLIVFDNVRHTIQLVRCVHVGDDVDLAVAYREAVEDLDSIEAMLDAPFSPPLPKGSGRQVRMQSNMRRDQYEAMVRKGVEFTHAGDIIQVVLAQHFSTCLEADVLDVYRALRHINPSPYMFLLDFADGRAIAGSSPEVMVRVTNELAELRPIAGTRPRGKTAVEDAELAEDLLADPKERAEHVMLVDLARNDLGRVCDIGSVEVTDYMTIERYSHVMHIVSHVIGRVRPEHDALDVFKASFPAGTLSGAPKVRAMEVIHQLEPNRRGPYGGALGYIAYGGTVMDLAITIRTVVMDEGRASVTAGAGIVFDSVPATEFEETVHKSQGMRRALQLAERGLALEETP